MFSFQFKELQATKLCLSRDGRLGMLSSRRHLALLDMDNPEDILRKVGRSSRWEVGGAQWNKHAQFSSHVSVCCNDKLEVWQWGAGGDSHLQATVRAHSRQVSDLDWSSTQPALIASSGLDGKTVVWDIRDLRRPCQTFSTIVAASHVRWSPDGQYLTSSHEGDIKVWDSRGESSPLSSVSVHMSRVHSIDWSPPAPDTPQTFVTASNDCNVRYHSLAGPRQVETSGLSLTTSVAVWTAKFTPFGDGLVTSLVPHFGVHDHSLFLWNNSDLTSPVHTFGRHRDVILDFDWRRCGELGADYQMVTWARDQTLRTWNLQQDILHRCGGEGDDLQSLDSGEEESSDDTLDQATEAVEEISFHKKSQMAEADRENVKPFLGLEKAESKIFKITESPVKEHSPECSLENTLQREFVLLETNFNHIQIVERDLERRTCRAVTVTGHARLLISITFPVSYPVNTPPIFTFLKGSTLGLQNRSKVLKLLQETACQQVRKNRACLERCLRQLDIYLDQLNQEKISEEEVSKNSAFPSVRAPDSYQGTLNFGAFQDTTHTPYPRTSGSRFCSNGLLVCFGRPTFQIQVSHDSPNSSLTPRAYSAYLSSVGAPSEQDFIFGQIPSTNRFSNLPTIHSVSSLTGSNHYEGGPPKEPKDTIKKGRFKVKRVASGAQEDGFLKMRRNPGRHQRPVLKVTVYDISSMLPVSKELAALYRVDSSDPLAMCQHNSAVAARLGRGQLSQVWAVVGQVLAAALHLQAEEGDFAPWSFSPLGKPLISSLLSHQARSRDFQTVALLVVALTSPSQPATRLEPEPEQREKARDKFWFLKSGALAGGAGAGAGESPYHTVHTLSTLRSGSASHTRLESLFSQRNTRSNSWTEAAQEDDTVQQPARLEAGHGQPRCGLLDPGDSEMYRGAIIAYCELLYNWGFLRQRTEVAQHGPLITEMESWLVRSDTNLPLICVICRLPVSGLSLICPVCGHGGHLAHLQQWHAQHDKCPARCSCSCRKYL